jgi:hypothetical protein
MIVIRSEWSRRVLDGSWWHLQADVAWGLAGGRRA